VSLLAVLPSLCAARSPFDAPEKSVNLYDYPAALARCRVMGLITTDTNGRVLLEINGDNHPSVYSKNDRIFIPFNGVIHEFTLEEIRRKGLKFKAKDNRTHEVELR
jgi:hypothetical protein